MSAQQGIVASLGGGEQVLPAGKQTFVMLKRAVRQLRRASRPKLITVSYYRILRVARTIADLEAVAGVLSRRHMAEALQLSAYAANKDQHSCRRDAHMQKSTDFRRFKKYATILRVY